jgi:hypothetical protein
MMCSLAPVLSDVLLTGLHRVERSDGQAAIHSAHGHRDDALRNSWDARCVLGFIPGACYQYILSGPWFLTSLQNCVTLWGNPSAFINSRWPYPLLVATTAITGMIVQVFLLRRLFSLWVAMLLTSATSPSHLWRRYRSFFVVITIALFVVAAVCVFPLFFEARHDDSFSSSAQS